MKSILFSSLFIIPSLLSAYELEFNKSFNKNIQNDKVHTNIRISVDSKEIDFINEKVEFFQDFIKENNSVSKKNGNYSLVPNYSYANNKQNFIGYKGTLHYSIETPKYENLNQFMTEIIDIKNNMKLILRKKVEKICNKQGFIDEVHKIESYQEDNMCPENLSGSL